MSKIIAGLGNPGPKYARTRHNLGFMVADAAAEKLGAAFDREKHQALMAQARDGGEKLLLLKPLTFMNRSGDAIVRFCRNIEGPDQVLVVVDDINLPLGRIRFRAGGSAGGHNGLKSVIERLGTDEFHRLRCGIGQQGQGAPLTDHVLAKFHPDERKDLDEMVERATDGVLCWVRGGIEEAMERFNRKG